MANIRKKVFLSLLSCEENGRYANLEADAILKREIQDERDKALYTALLYGVIERKITLDYQISKLYSGNPDSLQLKVRILLRIGLYQLLYMNSIPAYAAVNETVALAKATVNPGAAKLINGILRSALTALAASNGKLSIKTPDRTRDICGYLSIFYGYPRYLCKLWISAYGEEMAEKLMAAQNRRPIITLRVNSLKTNREHYLAELIKAGIEASPSQLTDDGIILNGGNITLLPGYSDGLFFVQDDAPRMAVSALSPRPGETIIDACACPGGKSFASAIIMKNRGKILSMDIHASKLSLISSGARRLGINIIEPSASDAALFQKSLEKKADRVLCDVPCSGFGTISKKPELRHKAKSAVDALPSLQYSILENCSRYVRDYGVLMYSTCTLNPAENEEIVSSFLEQNKQFTLIEAKTNFPCDSLSDGFFHALFKRN